MLKVTWAETLLVPNILSIILYYHLHQFLNIHIKDTQK